MLDQPVTIQCRQCGHGPLVQPRNGQRRDFCSPICRATYHNARTRRATGLLDQTPQIIAYLQSAIVDLDQGELDSAQNNIYFIIDLVRKFDP